ncbi:gas vesicle protein [Streptomyces sp. NPDC101118]|uniref:gas vesicle protein n=1 Tax=Streptomyces sp. NPDC101118 TaxID=3366109 RepID=UPI0038005A78
MTIAGHDEPLPGRQVALVDLLDRLLAGGVVISGDLVLSIADIDLVRISLRALITSVNGGEQDRFDAFAPHGGHGPNDHHEQQP